MGGYLPSAAFWTSSIHRCVPSSPPRYKHASIFIAHRVRSAFPLLVDLHRILLNHDISLSATSHEYIYACVQVGGLCQSENFVRFGSSLLILTPSEVRSAKISTRTYQWCLVLAAGATMFYPVNTDSEKNRAAEPTNQPPGEVTIFVRAGGGYLASSAAGCLSFCFLAYPFRA